jgi:hypothetical protein
MVNSRILSEFNTIIWNIVNKYVLNDLLLFFEPTGEIRRDMQREKSELRNGTWFVQQLKLLDDEIEVIKSDSNVEKVLKEILIIRETQCYLIKKFDK